MYTVLNKDQDQCIINIVECMRSNNIASMKFECDEGLTYYLSIYVYTIELNVKYTKNENGIYTSYCDRYTINKENYINYVDSDHEID